MSNQYRPLFPEELSNSPEGTQYRRTKAGDTLGWDRIAFGENADAYGEGYEFRCPITTEDWQRITQELAFALKREKALTERLLKVQQERGINLGFTSTSGTSL